MVIIRLTGKAKQVFHYWSLLIQGKENMTLEQLMRENERK